MSPENLLKFSNKNMDTDLYERVHALITDVSNETSLNDKHECEDHPDLGIAIALATCLRGFVSGADLTIDEARNVAAISGMQRFFKSEEA